MKALHTFPIAFLLCTLVDLSSPLSSYGQDIPTLVARADTSRFSVQHSEWSLLNFYQAIDSSGTTVSMEIIVANTSKKTDWTAEQYLGRIKDAPFHPKRHQEIEYTLLHDLYTIRIEHSGKCYLMLKKGSPVSGDVQILPLFVRYRIN